MVFVLVGIWVFITPVSSYIALAFLFAITFLVTGVIEIASAIFDKEKMRGWAWKLIVGIINLVIGVVLVARPAVTFAVLPIYVGFVVMLRAFASIGWSLDLKKFCGGWDEWIAFSIAPATDVSIKRISSAFSIVIISTIPGTLRSPIGKECASPENP